MADGTYQVKVYEKQGGAELVVASSGYITVESGGQVDVESGGHIDLESGGYISVADGGYIQLPVVTDTTAAALENSGVSVIKTTSVKRIFQLGAPAAGKEKYVVATVAAATSWASITSTGANANARFMLIGASTHKQVRMAATGVVHLVGQSSTLWIVVAKTTGASGQASH